MKLQQFAQCRCFQWMIIVLSALPCLYLLDLAKSALIGFVKFGWDSRPFVSIQIQNVIAFVSYATTIALISVSAGISSRQRLFIWAAILAIVSLGCFAIGVATYSLGVLSPNY